MLFGPGSCKQLNTGMRCVSKHFKSSSVGRDAFSLEKQSLLVSLGLMAAIIEPHYLAVCWHSAEVTHDTEPDVNRVRPSILQQFRYFSWTHQSLKNLLRQRQMKSFPSSKARQRRTLRSLCTTRPIYIKNSSFRSMYWYRLEAHFSIALSL